MSETESFHKDCKHYIINYHDNVKWLYWELIPEIYIGKKLEVKISILDAEWIREPEIEHVSIVNEFEEKKIISSLIKHAI